MSPESNQLADRLARQIEASGPISIAEYMRVANAEYYNRADPLGVDGDFITAPEISQMFGELIGMWLTDIWMRQGRPDACHYVELGPGRGTLAADALRAMAKFGLSPSVHFVETSAALRKKQAGRVPQAVFHDSIETVPTDAPLLIVANEFFDALPVRQIVATDSGWVERVVVVVRNGNKFAAAPGSSKMDALVPSAHQAAQPGSIFEISPDSAAVLYEIAGCIANQGGVLLVIDYGYSTPALGSTLQAVSAHDFADPFDNPGGHDLTAHVNFRDLTNVALARELRVSGPVTQGDFLQALGIDHRAAILARNAPDKADEIAAARQRLVNTDQMGALFKILAISAPEWVTPEGFGAG